MSMLKNLKIVSTNRPASMPPVVQRRNRLIAKIWEQQELAKAQQQGSSFSPAHTRTIKDPVTGSKTRIMTPKRIKPWWWTADNGKLCMSVRYGTQLLELAPGKSTIEIGSLDALQATLDTLKSAVASGELDAQIERASGAIRQSLRKAG
ncbi:MAG: DUF6641 family protein [Achromobacter veterisilvae]